MLDKLLVILLRKKIYFIYFYRLARLDAAGLLGKLQTDGIQKDAADCIHKIDQEISNSKIKGEKKRLTLEGLSGAFLVLGVGYSVAIAAFIVEVVHGYMRKREQNRINDNKLNVEVPRRPRLIKDRKELKVKNVAIEVKSEPLVGQSKAAEDKVEPKNISELGKNSTRKNGIQKIEVEVHPISKELKGKNAAIKIKSAEPLALVVQPKVKTVTKKPTNKIVPKTILSNDVGANQPDAGNTERSKTSKLKVKSVIEELKNPNAIEIDISEPLVRHQLEETKIKEEDKDMGLENKSEFVNKKQAVVMKLEDIE